MGMLGYEEIIITYGLFFHFICNQFMLIMKHLHIPQAPQTQCD